MSWIGKGIGYEGEGIWLVSSSQGRYFVLLHFSMGITHGEKTLKMPEGIPMQTARASFGLFSQNTSQSDNNLSQIGETENSRVSMTSPRDMSTVPYESRVITEIKKM